MKTCCFLNSVCFSLEIIRSPGSTVVFTDGVATFMCDAENSSDIRWTFNGSLSYQLPTDINETAVFVLVGDVGQSNLTFQGRAEYNTTVVQCIALLARAWWNSAKPNCNFTDSRYVRMYTVYRHYSHYLNSASCR